MPDEETLIEVRHTKHQEANGGAYPLASDYTSMGSLHSISFYIEAMGGNIKTTIIQEELSSFKTFLVHGRITAFRKSGAISFIKITDSSGSLQLIASKAAMASYDQLRLLDLGDIIEATGKPVLSKTGEKSILITELKLLTKAHRPPPEKYVGLANEELKARKRYLDLMSSEETRARFVVRSYVIRAIREFMQDKNFLEVETSTLNSISSGANAKPFTTHHNALDMDLFLRIAPELYLKRLIVGGMDKVFEIGRNYRNEGIDSSHNPEFTMMEFYEAYGRFPDLINYTKTLLLHVREYCRTRLPTNVKPYFQKWDEESPFSLSQFVEVPMWDAVIKACGKAELMIHPSIHPLVDLVYELGVVEALNLSNERLQKIDVKGLFHALNDCSSNGEKIYTLFEYVVEPFLTEDYRSEDKSCPVFITQYPKAVSPLARAFDDSPTLCERFELFVDGRELANAFQELNDPEEQALRFNEQLSLNNKDPMDFDSDYIEALQYGMPPCIGFGMGIERLCMLLTGTQSIKDVILFPTLKNKNEL